MKPDVNYFESQLKVKSTSVYHGNIFGGEAVVILVFMSDLSFIQKRTVQIRDVKADFLRAKMKTK